MNSETIAMIDRRKALIVACLYPTRVKRGFTTLKDCERLAAEFGMTAGGFSRWEDGRTLVPEDKMPAVEAWLASGPVYRYAGIDRVVGPEAWPKPLDMPTEDA